MPVTVDEPRYWGTWKGSIIQAIATFGFHSWQEIRDFTGLSTAALNRELSEMLSEGIIEERFEEEYWVREDIYREYIDYEELAGALSDYPLG